MAQKYLDIAKEVIEKYKVEVNSYCKFGCYSRTHAHIKERVICKLELKNSVSSLFTLLHEIGHCETTKSKMRRCESEYEATVFALKECKRYGIEVPDKIIKEYQDYIDMEHDRGVRRGGNLPPLEEFQLRRVK